MKTHEKVDRGVRIATTSLGSYGNLAAVSWMDTKPVHLISTGLNTSRCSVMRRERGKQDKFNVTTINTIKQYQSFMGGVDRHDYLRMANYCVQSNHVFKKWYKAFFAAMNDLVLVNSYVLWKIKNIYKRSTTYDHDSFYEKISLGLLSINLGHNTRSRKSSPSTTPKKGIQQKLQFHGHNLVRYAIGEGYSGRELRYRRCFVCQKYKERRESEYYCSICKVCVCKNGTNSGRFCWLDLHCNEEFMVRIEKRRR